MENSKRFEGWVADDDICHRCKLPLKIKKEIRVGALVATTLMCQSGHEYTRYRLDDLG